MNSIDAFRSDLRSDDTPTPSTALARGLGMFSLALGTAELVAPKFLSRGIGIKANSTTTLVTRLMGIREIAAGLGVLLASRRPEPLWARVAGDAIDLALLGLAATRATSGLKLAGAVAAVGGVTALDVLASVKAQKAKVAANRPVIYSVTINKSPMTVYEFYRDFARLPEFMDYLVDVHEIDQRHSHWVATLGGKRVSWDAEITEDIPGEVIAWRSAEGAWLKTRGRVTFAKAPGRDATEVRVEMQLGVKGIAPSDALAKLVSEAQIKGDLRRLKQVLETGEVLLSDSTVTTRPHPAQPSELTTIAKNPHWQSPVIQPDPPVASSTKEVG